MSQVDISKASGLSKGSISSYISGRYEPRGDRIFLLANALNVNPVWLSGFDASMLLASEVDVNKATDIANIADKLQCDPDFFELVSKIYDMTPEQRRVVKTLVDNIK